MTRPGIESEIENPQWERKVNSGARYTLYHPKWYRRPVSVWWWLESWPYARFVLRELTSVAVGYFALITLWQVHAIRRGPEAYARVLARLRSPLFIVFDVIALGFVLFHSVTWFNLAPKAMVLRVGGKRVRDSALIGANYAAWVLISAVLAWIVVRGHF